MFLYPDTIGGFCPKFADVPWKVVRVSDLDPQSMR